MKEIRITLRSEDFAAASKSMIDLGLKFRVEPVVVEKTIAREPSASPPREVRRRTTRVPRRGSASKQARGADREATGADRLRAMVERNRLAPGRPADEAQSGPGEAGLDADTEPPAGGG